MAILLCYSAGGGASFPLPPLLILAVTAPASIEGAGSRCLHILCLVLALNCPGECGVRGSMGS